jgi:hypothetical protein
MRIIGSIVAASLLALPLVASAGEPTKDVKSDTPAATTDAKAKKAKPAKKAVKAPAKDAAKDAAKPAPATK